MTIEEASELVTFMLSASDMKVSDDTFSVWTELFAEEEDLTYAEALAAAKASVKYHTAVLVPKHVFVAVANRRAEAAVEAVQRRREAAAEQRGVR